MAGFTGTVFTSFDDPLTLTIAAPTFNVSTYVPNPAAATSTVRAGLQAALTAVGAAGGTLTFDVPDTTYQINASLTLANKSRFRIVGNDCTIFHANGWDTTPSFSVMLDLTGATNFRIEDITFDGNRTGAGVPNAEVPSPNIAVRSCKFASFIRVKSINAPTDEGFRLDTGSGNIGNVTAFPTDLLFYKCEALRCYRLGFFVRCGRNIQVLGGSYSYTKGTGPSSGMDFEPEVEFIPACDQVLIRGASFIGNERSGIQTASKRGSTRMTVEGCYFSGLGGVPLQPPPVPDRGSGLSMGFNDMVIQKNTFELFNTDYNGITSVITLPNLAAPVPGTILILDNVFNDNTQNQTCIRINSSNGGGIQVTGNRAYDVSGSMNEPPNSTANVTFTNNIKTTGAPTYPSPMPPWDVTFAEDGSDPDPPGGAIEFDANSTSGSEHSSDASWTHTPVGTPKGVVVLIVGRLGSAGQTDEVLGVTYGGVALTRAPLGFASDTLTETGSAYAYHLGMGIPTGAQTVAIDFATSPVGFYRAHCYTVTADGDTVVTASGVVEENVANPAISLVTPAGFECFVGAALFSGAATAGVAVGADYTEVADYEQAAARTMNFMRRTSDSTGGTVIADWIIAAADDVAGVAIAINSSGTVPVVNVLVQPTGFSRTRVLGTVNVNVSDPPVVTLQPLGLERTSLRALGNVALAINTVVEVPAVGYTALTDEQMSVQLIASTNGPIDPNVVRNCLMTLRDRGAQSQSGAIDSSFTLLETFEFDMNLNDNTCGTVDPYFARSAVLTLADRLTNITQPTSTLDGTYRLLSAADMLTYMRDDTCGYVDPYIMRSAILCLRDWLNQVPI